MTQEEAAVAAQQQEERMMYALGGVGLLATGWIIYSMLNALESVQKNRAKALRQQSWDQFS